MILASSSDFTRGCKMLISLFLSFLLCLLVGSLCWRERVRERFSSSTASSGKARYIVMYLNCPFNSKEQTSNLFCLFYLCFSLFWISFYWFTGLHIVSVFHSFWSCNFPSLASKSPFKLPLFLAQKGVPGSPSAPPLPDPKPATSLKSPGSFHGGAS